MPDGGSCPPRHASRLNASLFLDFARAIAKPSLFRSYKTTPQRTLHKIKKTEEMMYHFSKTLALSFADAIERTQEALKQEGFGVLTVIDAQAAFKQKIGADFRPYTILGACHPGIAYNMLQIDDKAGVFYPCNVVVQEREAGMVEVSAVNPLAMFVALPSPQAQELALEASEMMQRAIANL